jgi:hypothetical protein
LQSDFSRYILYYMDNHPIPQDVTHFQFKLIGELTIKQFGYVAAGGVLGWIVISIKTLLIVKLPIALIFAGTGLIFAFVPIEGRPADMMLSYFFRALFHPNQYLFQKQGSLSSVIASSQKDLTTPPPTNAPVAPQALTPQQQYRQALNTSMFPPIRQPVQYQPQVQAMPQGLTPPPIPAAPSAPVQAPRIPTPPPMPKVAPTQNATPVLTPPPLPVEVPAIPQPVQKAPATPIQTPITKPAQMPPVQAAPTTTTPSINSASSTAGNQLQDALAQKKQLEEQLAKLQQQLAQANSTPSVNSGPATTQTVSSAIPPQIAVPPIPQQPTAVSAVVKTMAAPAQTTSKLPLVSDFPNIIIGVVKDARGNVLPNILIEVKDVDDNPVRAFKTNALGQFASATPLLNGTYTVLFEDPAKTHKFDALQIAVTGDIMQPIEVVSFDEREGLRKELFG